MLKTDCQWRNLPEEWPHWQAFYYYFEQWSQDDTFERINFALNQLDRKQVNKEALASVFCIDSQRIKLKPMIFGHRSTDANKRVNGRKRQLIVDTQDRLWWLRAIQPIKPTDQQRFR
ncbi:transposase [Spirosoma koreense]